MAYKLLALDMDGTMLNSAKRISPKTASAIADLASHGVHVVVSTGRALAELSDYKSELKFMHYGIAISGGLVYDFVNAKPVTIHPVPENIMLEIIDAGIDERAMIHLLGVHESLMREDDIQHTADFQMSVYQEMYDRVSTRCDDFKAYILAHPNEIIKVNLYHRSPESRARTFERLKHLDLTFALAETTALEASPKGVTKASGLRELCNFLKIDINDTIAVGDAPNDIEILKAAGIAAVMGNATAEIKALADFITDDNDHDGIVRVIDKFF